MAARAIGNATIEKVEEICGPGFKPHRMFPNFNQEAFDAQKGWNQTPGLQTWFKVQFWKDVQDFRSPLAWCVFVSHPILTLAGLACVPRVVRRFGWSYGSFALLGLAISAISTKNFFGMSRYVLSAFPCFAVAGEQAGTKNARMRHGARSGTLSRQRGTRTSHARPTHDQ